jgi:DNA polymerase-3 subunit beta
MKFTIQRDQLLKPLHLLNNVVEKRQTLPILGNVLLTAENELLSLTGTDLEVELCGQAVISKLTDAGEITVPAKKLFDICRSLPDNSELNIKVENHKLFVHAGKSRFNLLTLPALEFPKVKDASDGVRFTVSSAELKLLLDSTQFAMAQQDVRYYLNGSLWHIENNTLTCVATDGHRLAVSHINVEAELAETNAQIIVPRKAIIEMNKIITEASDTIEVVIGANHVKLITEDFVLTSKLIDGRFPDYNNVIPKHNDFKMVVDRDALKPVLTRVAILSNEKYRGVRLTLEENKLKVMANNPEHEEAEEEIDVAYSGDSFEVGLNVNYIIDALNTLPKGNIVFWFGGAEKSVLLEHEKEGNIHALNAIMPMRL